MSTGWAVAVCAKCGKSLIDGPRGTISHIIEDDDLYYHELCFKGELPDSLKAWYAAEAKTKPKS